jgi:predicted pyridoxine 5'-phosphate oxidase superfamily flavin-nucleotide-binding protein
MISLAAPPVHRRQRLAREGGETVGIITEDMRRIVDSAKLAFVATVCEDGSPNLSPKGSLLVYDDDQLIFMNMASPTTVKNLRHDPRLEVNVVDFLLRRGYRFKGTGELRGPGDRAYMWMREWVRDTHGPEYPVHEAVLIQVERALPVESPAYTFGHWSEDRLKRAWAHKYELECSGDPKLASTGHS